MNSRGILLGSVSLSIVVFCVVLSQAPRASAQSVYSVNALAYADVNLSAGSNFITNPFSKPNNTISNLFPSMPGGSYLRIHEPTLQDFGPTNSFGASTGWSDPAATLFLPQGALMWVPAPTQILFSGEVFQGAVTGRMHQGGMYVLGVIPRNGFFVCGNFEECGPAQPPDGTSFCKWNRSQQRCVSYYYFDPIPGFPGGWLDEMFNPADPKLEAGESGVFNVPTPFSVPALPALEPLPSPTTGIPLVNTRRDGTNLTFQFVASDEASFLVERSTNLTEDIWHTIQAGSVSNSPMTVTLTDTTNAFAFYRVRPQTFSSQPYLFGDARTTGQFSFRFYAPTSAIYEVQRTIAPDALLWQTISSIAVGAKGFVNFKDTNAVVATARYRVRFNP
jgi:hypothetical protein